MFALVFSKESSLAMCLSCPVSMQKQFAVVRQSRIFLDKGRGVKKSKTERSCHRVFLQFRELDGLGGWFISRTQRVRRRYP